MEIQINIEEVARNLADKDLRMSYFDEGGFARFPNGLVIDEDEDHYTEEAQRYFNRKYDIWWEYFFKASIDNQVKKLNLK